MLGRFINITDVSEEHADPIYVQNVYRERNQPVPQELMLYNVNGHRYFTMLNNDASKNWLRNN